MTIMEIKHRYTGAVIYSGEAQNLRELVIRAVTERADLSGASLSGADLSEADLSGAILSGASLSRANLYGASLYEANLYGADLSGANLSWADLSEASLSGANLYGANLSRANLSRQHIYQFSGIGSARRMTTYWVEANKIWCGCFAGTPKEFIQRVQREKAGNPRQLREYLAGIRFFLECKRAIPAEELAAGRRAYAEMQAKAGEKAAA